MILDYVTPAGEIRRGQPIDTARLAAAYLNKPARALRAAPAPTEPAPTREPCARCGVPGINGCDHWLPFVSPESVADAAARRLRGQPVRNYTDYSILKG